MKKENLVNYIKMENKMRMKAMSKNTITDDEREAMEAAVEAGRAVIDELAAAEEPKTMDDFKNMLDARIDELSQSLSEKIKEVESQDKLQKVSVNYLNSANSIHDFAEALRETRQTQNWCAAWSKKLTKNGITFETDAEALGYIPEAVKGLIQDSFEKTFPWFAKLKRVNAKNYIIRWNTADQMDETSRAKGHKRGDAKVQEVINLDAKQVLGKAIYKIIHVDNEIIWNDDNSLISYIVSESTSQWVFEACLTILVGDGRSSASPDLRVMGLEPILRSVSDKFVTVFTRNSSTYPDIIDQLVSCASAVRVNGENDKMMFMSQQNLDTARRMVASSTGSPVYIKNEELADMIGVREIIATDMLGTSAEAICLSANAYVVVGGLEPRFASQEDLDNNVVKYRFENFIGGAMEKPLGASVLLPE